MKIVQLYYIKDFIYKVMLTKAGQELLNKCSSNLKVEMM